MHAIYGYYLCITFMFTFVFFFMLWAKIKMRVQLGDVSSFFTLWDIIYNIFCFDKFFFSQQQIFQMQ